MARSAKFRLISYLDLICCGFGGTLLLLLIALSAAPVRSTENQLVVIRCRHHAGARAEVGLEYQAPGNSDWVRPMRAPRVGGMVVFSARSRPASGADAIIILTKPAAGLWKVRPYLVDFPSLVTEVKGGGTGAANEVQVTVEAMGRGVYLAGKEDRVSRLSHPGDTGNAVTVAIDSALPDR